MLVFSSKIEFHQYHENISEIAHSTVGLHGWSVKTVLLFNHVYILPLLVSFLSQCSEFKLLLWYT